MDPRLAIVVPLLLAASLSGCMGPEDSDGDDAARCGTPASLEAGDLARVRFVERFADGHVHNASVPGDHPPNATLDDLAGGSHDEVWWMLWGGFVDTGDGQDTVTRVQLADLTADRVADAVATFRRDAQASGGESVSLWYLPPNVTDPASVPNQGLFSALAGLGVGDGVTNLTVPPEAGFGPHDPNATITLDARRNGEPRRLENLSKRQVQLKSNLTQDTEEGDVVSYELFEGGTVSARVTELGSRRVSLYLVVQEGELLSFHGWWNTSIVGVTNDTYDLLHHAEEGTEVRDRGRVGRVTQVDGVSIVLDFNDPRAGHTMVYDVEVREIASLCRSRDLWSHPVDPVADGARVNDVAMLERSMPTVATDRGAFFTATARWGQGWFSLAPELSGREVKAIAAAPFGEGTVVASVAEAGVLVSRDFGVTWSDPAGEGLDGPPSDVTVTGGSSDVLYALRGGDVLRSDDAGASWRRVGAAPAETRSIEGGAVSTDRLWAATGEGVSRSDDGGASWEATSLDAQPIRDVSVFADGFVYASTGFSVLATSDGGGSWQTQGTVQASRIDTLPRLPTWILAQTGPAGVGMSQDAGARWLRVLG